MAFRIECKIRGLGWVLFFMAASREDALALSEQAKLAGDKFPGKSPRKVRIVERMDEHGMTDPNGAHSQIHTLNGKAFIWPAQWTASRLIAEETPGVHF